MSPPIPLSIMRHDEEARIQSLVADGAMQSRLQELGLVPGNRVRLLREGSPCILLVDDSTRLCLRADDAERILVQIV